MLAPQLGVDNMHYADVDSTAGVIHGRAEHSRVGSSFVGTYPLGEWGAHLLQHTLGQGRTLVVDDVTTCKLDAATGAAGGTAIRFRIGPLSIKVALRAAGRRAAGPRAAGAARPARTPPHWAVGPGAATRRRAADPTRQHRQAYGPGKPPVPAAQVRTPCAAGITVRREQGGLDSPFGLPLALRYGSVALLWSNPRVEARRHPVLLAIGEGPQARNRATGGPSRAHTELRASACSRIC